MSHVYKVTYGITTQDMKHEVRRETIEVFKLLRVQDEKAFTEELREKNNAVSLSINHCEYMGELSWR